MLLSAPPGPHRHREAARGRPHARLPDRVRDPKSVVLAYIHPGQVSSYFTESMIATLFYDRMGRRPPRIANIYQEWSSANVSASRNIVTQRFWTRTTPTGCCGSTPTQWSPLDVDVLLDAADREDGAGDRRAVLRDEQR